MRFAARFFSRFIVVLACLAFLLPSFSKIASAQTTQQTPINSSSRPNVEADVPQNQHTYVQAMFIEMLVTIECQLTGIDLINPGSSCLGINLNTGKLGYAPPSQNGSPIGGVLGMINGGISATYTPAYSTKDYIHYMANSFGIKKTYAAPVSAFEGLSPILGLWRMVRDIAYFLLAIAFIFIGIGVMLRIHIDPRTVMTVQNQIPRVIICIILITFSYAFAALMADTMWVVTYMGINKLTETVNPASYHVCGNNLPYTLSQYATTQIIQTPITFADNIFSTMDCGILHSGIWEISSVMALNLSSIEWNLFLQIIGIDPNKGCTQNGTISGAIASIPGMSLIAPAALPLDLIFNFGNTVKSLASCIIGKGLGAIITYFTNIAWFFIISIIVVITLFRIWFELLKAYIMILVYIILAPLWIVFGLLPKKPLGFEKWLRAYFSHLAVFPATVFILITARLFYQLFNVQPDSVFVPPLVGNPYAGNFGAILEFGMLLMTPTLLSIIREKLGTPPLKQAQAIGQAFTAGRQAVGTVGSKTMAPLNKRNPTTGTAEGPLAVWRDTARSAGLRFMFEKDKGLFAAKGGANEGLIARAGRKASEKADRKAAGDPYWATDPDKFYRNNPRGNPANAADVTRINDIMANKKANTRSVDDEQFLEDMHHLLTADQSAQRAGERSGLELTIRTPKGEQTVKLDGETKPAAELMLDHLNDQTPGGQAAASAVRALAGTPQGQYLNNPLGNLSPLERAKVQAFLTSNAQHMKPLQPQTPPAAQGGGGTTT